MFVGPSRTHVVVVVINTVRLCYKDKSTIGAGTGRSQGLFSSNKSEIQGENTIIQGGEEWLSISFAIVRVAVVHDQSSVAIFADCMSPFVSENG